ncbi:hypothetical protein [Streptomyces sp. NPDC001933]|uniref:hypothetical protein n=1 Tax=Streptomyces sp. NPDC001933 TaxID=3364626 RepID=UPI003686F9BB
MLGLSVPVTAVAKADKAARTVTVTTPGAGCPFAARCERARERCHDDAPGLTDLGPGRQVACWYPVGPAAATSYTEEATS